MEKCCFVSYSSGTSVVCDRVLPATGICDDKECMSHSCKATTKVVRSRFLFGE